MTFIIRLPFDTKPQMNSKTICVKITEWQLKNVVKVTLYPSSLVSVN